jgi:hypothetical protein
MRAATAYCLGDGWYFHSESRTTSGVWIATCPYLRVDRDAPNSEKGRALIEALNKSQASVEHPSDWTGFFDPMLRLAGQRSWVSFAQDAACLGIEEQDGVIRILPKRNLGPKEGFEPIPEQRVAVPLSSPYKEIGDTLELSLKHCEMGRAPSAT